jgi:hypothetical protein
VTRDDRWDGEKEKGEGRGDPRDAHEESWESGRPDAGSELTIVAARGKRTESTPSRDGRPEPD